MSEYDVKNGIKSLVTLLLNYCYYNQNDTIKNDTINSGSFVSFFGN
jgi:hypothetical protein